MISVFFGVIVEYRFHGKIWFVNQLTRSPHVPKFIKTIKYTFFCNCSDKRQLTSWNRTIHQYRYQHEHCYKYERCVVKINMLKLELSCDKMRYTFAIFFNVHVKRVPNENCGVRHICVFSGGECERNAMSSIHIWRKYFRDRAKDGRNWRPKPMKILNSFHSIFLHFSDRSSRYINKSADKFAN